MKLYSEETMQDVKSAVDAEVLRWPGVRPNKRFGCPCYEADGKLFAFLVTGGMVLTQLPEAERDRLTRGRKASAFEAGGRTVQRWTKLPLTVPRELPRLLPYIRMSHRAASEAAKGA